MTDLIPTILKCDRDLSPHCIIGITESNPTLEELYQVCGAAALVPVILWCTIILLLKMFKVLRLMTSIGIEKSIDTSCIDEKVLNIVLKSIFTVSPTTRDLAFLTPRNQDLSGY